jgi:hypothetical protein
MLGLAGTIELRENMPISLIHKPMRHIQFIGVIAGLLSILLPEQGYALQVSPPVGTQEIGKRLNLKSSLSGIPEGAESQLRSACLKARIKSIETSSSVGETNASSDVSVNFQPTMKQGGLLEFRSTEPVNDSLVEMELVSECPLVVFTSRWTLIMNVSASPMGYTVALQTAQTAQESVNFDFGNSSLLSASRRAPKPVSQYGSMRNETKIESKPQPEKPVELTSPVNEETAAVVEQEAAFEPVNLASLPQEILAPGFIESRTPANLSNEGDWLEDVDQSQSDGSAGLGGLIPVEYWQVIVSLTLLGLLALVYLVKKRSQRAGFKVAVPKRDPFAVAPQVSVSEFRENGFQVDEPKQEIPGYTTDRMLESLIVNDETNYEDMFDLGPLVQQSDLLDSSKKSSLKISHDLINRADIPIWNLPATYHGLVEQRNKSLELHRTSDALLLRCHIGLVELAFQDARQGHETQGQNALDLLTLVLGEHVYDAHTNSTLCVPDVVKSHVRAKMCEITGAEKRQLLRDNLISLNMQVLSPALCFHTDAWREFLSDEGALN